MEKCNITYIFSKKPTATARRYFAPLQSDFPLLRSVKCVTECIIFYTDRNNKLWRFLHMPLPPMSHKEKNHLHPTDVKVKNM